MLANRPVSEIRACDNRPDVLRAASAYDVALAPAVRRVIVPIRSYPFYINDRVVIQSTVMERTMSGRVWSEWRLSVTASTT